MIIQLGFPQMPSSCHRPSERLLQYSSPSSSKWSLLMSKKKISHCWTKKERIELRRRPILANQIHHRAAEMEGIIVVFDFDKTIIDVDSDNWVVDELGFTDLFNRLLPTMPWNSLMEMMMKEMHEQGVTIHDIVKVLRRIPIHPRIIPAIKSAYAAGCDLRVVSDANEFFIETVLDNLGIRSCFSEIHTNPGHVDEHGRLRIGSHHDFTRGPHGCECPCPPNMCKGHVIDQMLADLDHNSNNNNNSSSRIIYLGDGLGDYCPALKLRSCDFAMPRKDFPAHELIVASDPKLVKAEVQEWSDGTELESVLLGLIAKVTAATATHVYTDRKFPATETLFKPLPVPH